MNVKVSLVKLKRIIQFLELAPIAPNRNLRNIGAHPSIQTLP